ncbi:MAG: hypothetical protein IT384_34565 [Deltaproteobacteria bacterium]|nr:hypothetical protein [Deltaproteobacteria bacterium]
MVLAQSCGTRVQAQILDPSSLDPSSLDPIRVRAGDCEEAEELALLEYPFLPEVMGWMPGPLITVDPAQCAATKLPETDRVHVLSLSARDDALRVEPALTEVLRDFRYLQPCPCDRPLEIAERVPLARPARLLAVQAIDADAVLIMAVGGGGRRDFYRYDLETLEHLFTATVALDGSGGDPGPHLLAPGPAGTFYFSGTSGDVYELSYPDRFRLFAQLTGGVAPVALAASRERPELYVLTEEPPSFQRFVGGAWRQVRFDAAVPEEGSRRAAVLWIEQSRAIAMPTHSRGLVFTDGDLALEEPWDSGAKGAVQALADVAEIGVVAATRIHRFYRIDTGTPGRFDELIGPSGQVAELNHGWMGAIVGFQRGFVGADDSGLAVTEYHPSWGYCPTRSWRREATDPRTIGSFVAIGGALVAGGSAEAAWAAGRPPVLLVLRPSP